jgi:predicted nucleic acid-binding protein
LPEGDGIGRTLYGRAILIDSGPLIALANNLDSKHAVATDCLQRVVAQRLPVLVTRPTIHEAHRRILFDAGFRAAMRFLRAIFDGQTTVVEVINDDVADAIKFITQYEARRLTLTDATSMAVMLRLQVAQVFSFDDDFLIAGFRRIPPL